jgi:hypothetical protein
MDNQLDPQAMDEYYSDCASLPDPLQPHGDADGALPGPHPPWRPVSVPEDAQSMADEIGPYV